MLLNLVTILSNLKMMFVMMMLGMTMAVFPTVTVKRVVRATSLRDKPGDNGVETGHPAGGATRGAKPTKAGIVLGGLRSLATGGTMTRGGTNGMDGVLHPTARALQMAERVIESPRNPQRIRGQDLSLEEIPPDGMKDLSSEVGSQLQTHKARASVGNPKRACEDHPRR